MTTKTKTRILPRIDDEGVILLAFPDIPARAGFVEVYEKIGQHSEAHRQYIRLHTKPVSPSNPGAAALIREWCTLGPADIHTPPESLEFVTLSDLGKYW